MEGKRTANNRPAWCKQSKSVRCRSLPNLYELRGEISPSDAEMYLAVTRRAKTDDILIRIFSAVCERNDVMCLGVRAPVVSLKQWMGAVQDLAAVPGALARDCHYERSLDRMSG